MNIPQDINKRMMAAFQLLQSDIISVSAFDNVRQLIKGINSELDGKLEVASKALSKLEKLQAVDIITLSAESLPEDTEEKKKKKKLLLFFISSIKDLRSEIKRVQTEYGNANKVGNSVQNNISFFGRLIARAKGPLGIVTLAAVVIVGVTLMQAKRPSTHLVITPKPIAAIGVQAIVFNGKQIPLSQLRVGNPHAPNCTDYHYHANNQAETVTATDGTILYDPGNCGFGKVNETKIITISQK